MIKFNLLKESNKTTKWNFYEGDLAYNYVNRINNDLYVFNTVNVNTNDRNSIMNVLPSMRILYGNPGSGKTTELLAMSYQSGQVIVCCDENMKRYCLNRARELNFRGIPTPITYYEFIEERYRGRNFNGLLIDDIDCFLNYIARGTPVKGFTVRTYGY